MPPPSSREQWDELRRQEQQRQAAARNARTGTQPGAPTVSGYDVFKQGTLAGGAQQAVAPSGDVSSPSPAPNYLNMPNSLVMQAADAYRALPENASPEDRANARADYQQALIAARPVADEATKIAHYNQTLKDVFKVNPQTIRSGGERLTTSGGMAVTPIADQVAAAKAASDQARDIARMQMDEETLRRRTKRGEAEPGALLAARALGEQWRRQAS